MQRIYLTTQEIAQYRSQLVDYEAALISLDTIEDCEGDLEDAAVSLAIKVGQKPDRLDWLDGLSKRCRVAICQDKFQKDLLQGKLATTVGHLINAGICPQILVTPVVIYVMKQGIEEFCHPLSFKI